MGVGKFRAVKGGNDKFTLMGYSGQHHQDCVPNAAYLAVKKVRAGIKARVLADPTEKPTSVYVSEVNRVRDLLCKIY